MIDQRPQDGGGRGSAKRADKSPVIVAGPPHPAAVASGHPRGVVEQMPGLCKHGILWAVRGIFRDVAPNATTSEINPDGDRSENPSTSARCPALDARTEQLLRRLRA